MGQAELRYIKLISLMARGLLFMANRLNAHSISMLERTEKRYGNGMD